MSVTSTTMPVAAAAAVPTRRHRIAAFTGQFGFWLAVGWLALLAILALLAPWLPIKEYRETAGPPRLRPHLGWPEPLGTDDFGRSMLSRCIYGARISLTVGLLAAALGMLVGGAFGVVAGYVRGKTEGAISIFTDALLAFPPLVLLLSITATVGTTLPTLIVALAVLTVPTFVRLGRAHALATSQREFVFAARSIGARDSRIVLREIVPNVVGPVMSYTFLVMAVVIVAEGSLSFLGLGVPPPHPSWGGMINDGRTSLSTTPHLVMVPGAVLFLTVFAMNTVGDRLQAGLGHRSAGG